MTTAPSAASETEATQAELYADATPIDLSPSLNFKRPAFGGKLPSRRATKKGARHRGDNGAGMKPFPAAQPLHVLALPQEASLTEELLFLGALAQLKDQHPSLKVAYATENLAVYEMLEKAWFLADRHFMTTLRPGFRRAAVELEQPELAGVGGTEAARERLHVQEIGTPDLARYRELEQQSARSRYDHVEQLYKFQREMREKNPEMAAQFGLLELPELPEFNFAAQWNLATGYLLAIVELLGLKITAPGEPILPWIGMPKHVLRQTTRDLENDIDLDGPFGVFDFTTEATTETELEGQEVLLAILDRIYPGFHWIAAHETAEIILRYGARGLSALIQHPNCRIALGPQGSLTQAAWAAKLPTVLLYSGDKFAWDAPQGEAMIAIQRDAPEYVDDVARFRAHFAQVALELSRYIDRS